MRELKRRDFIRTTVLASAAVGVAAGCAPTAPEKKGRDATADMPLGIIVSVDQPEKGLERVTSLGFSNCEMGVEDFSAAQAARVKTALAGSGIAPTALICNGPGELVWDYYGGPRTIGLVPPESRAIRVTRLKEAVDFCAVAGIPAVNSHFGFIPEDPNDPLYAGFIEAAKEVAVYARERGILIRFETGQETPIALLRTIVDIGTDNLGVNYDTANLILYGKANPVDGLEVLGKYVQSLHAKDGLYPTEPRELGTETPIGEGWVDFPAVFRKLKAIGFKGHVTIEREIEGEQQTRDILKSRDYLRELIRTV